MKRTLLVLSLMLVMGLMATFAYAQEPNIILKDNEAYEQWENWHKEKIEWKRSRLEQAVKDGEITEEQAETWREHFNSMEEFHKENGSMLGGVCGRGFGMGMMRGNRWNRR